MKKYIIFGIALVLLAGFIVGTVKSDLFVGYLLKRQKLVVKEIPIPHKLIDPTTLKWEQTNGPEGGDDMVIIAMASNNPSTLYTGSHSNLFKTTDKASNWTLNNTFPNEKIFRIIINPKNNNTIYVLTTSNIYKSIDEGNNWNKITNNIVKGEKEAFYLLEINKSNPDIIYLGSHHPGKIYMTSDGGDNWEDITGDLDTEKIGVISVSDNDLYIGAGGSLMGESGELYHSNNNGKKWDKVNCGQSEETFVSSIYSSPNKDVILVGFGDPYNRMWHNVVGYEKGGYLFRSIDNGKNWSEVLIPTKLDSYINFLKNSFDSNTIFLSTDALYKSEDKGITWDEINTPCFTKYPCFDFKEIAEDPNNENEIYIPFGSGVMKSSDLGETWDLAQEGIIGSAVTNLVIDPSNSQRLYAGTMAFASGGVQMSNDGGKTWDLISDQGIDHPYIDEIGINPSRTNEVYAISDKNHVFKSTDYGENWNELITPTGGQGIELQPGFRFESVSTISVAPSDPEKVYIVRDGFGVYKNKEDFRTSKDGKWNYLLNSPDYTYSIAVHPTNPDIVLSGHNRKVFEKEARIYKYSPEIKNYLTLQNISSEKFNFLNSRMKISKVQINQNDPTWEEVYKFDNALSVGSLKFDTKKPSTVYAGINGENGTIYVSKDTGESWDKLNPDLTFTTIWGHSQLQIDPNDKNTVYAGTWNGGSFKTTDAGKNWKQLDKSHTFSPTCLAISPSNSNIIYACDRTAPIIHKSIDKGKNWIEFYNFGDDYFMTSAIEVDPEDPHTIYAAGFQPPSSMNGGLFKIKDGKKIESLNKGLPRSVIEIEIDPNDKNTIYATTHAHGVYKSINSGKKWVQLDDQDSNNTLPRTGIYDIDVDPLDSNVLYTTGLCGEIPEYMITPSNITKALSAAGIIKNIDPSAKCGVYKSTDKGKTWKLILETISEARGIEIHPTNNELLFVADMMGGVWVSTNGGDNWKQENSGLGSISMTSVRVQDDYIYASTQGSGVYSGKLDVNRGTIKWDQARSNKPKAYIYNIQIDIDPSNSQTIYASSFSGGLLRSDDGGKNWNDKNFLTPSIKVDDPITQGYYSFAIDPKNPNNVWMGAYGKGMFKSHDKMDFNMFANGDNDVMKNKHITKVAINPTNTNEIYVASEEGIYMTKNEGEDWTEFNQGLDTKNIFTLEFSSEGDLYCGTKGSGVYYYNKDEKEWQQVSTIGNFGTFWSWWDRPTYMYSDMLFDSEDPDTLFIGTFPSGMYKSEDNGKTWKEKNTGFNTDGFDGFFTLTQDPKDKDTIYAGTYNGISVSYDKGEHWQRISKGIPDEQWPFSVAVDPVDPKIIYAATKNGMDKGFCGEHEPPNDFCGTVIKTINGGQTWVEITNGLDKDNEFYQIIIYPKNHNILFVNSQHEGVYISLNAGKSWEPINNGLDNLKSAINNNVGVNMAIDKNGDYLYLGTLGSGVWKLKL